MSLTLRAAFAAAAVAAVAGPLAPTARADVAGCVTSFASGPATSPVSPVRVGKDGSVTWQPSAITPYPGTVTSETTALTRCLV